MPNNTQTPTQNTTAEQEIKAAVEAMFRKAVPQPVSVEVKKAPAPKKDSK